MEDNVNSFSRIICIFWNTSNHYFIKRKVEYRKEKQSLKLENDLKEKKIKEIDAQIKQLKLEQEDLKKAKGVSGNAK